MGPRTAGGDQHSSVELRAPRSGLVGGGSWGAARSPGSADGRRRDLPRGFRGARPLGAWLVGAPDRQARHAGPQLWRRTADRARRGSAGHASRLGPRGRDCERGAASRGRARGGDHRPRRVRPGVEGVRGLGKRAFWRFNWLIRHQIIRALERARPHARGTLLDVGCGAKPFAPVFDGAVDHYFGVDLPGSRDLGRPGQPQPDAYARAEALSIRDQSVGTVLALSLVTYLPEPSRFLEEAARVLAPGGVAILEFTQMAPLHPWLADYFRFTRTGAAWLVERAGFEVVEMIPIGGLMTRVGLSAIGALNRMNRGPTRVLTELPVRLLYVVL